MKTVYIKHEDFYRRTPEDQKIIDGLIERRITELGRCDDYRNQANVAKWAKAYNDFFRDYQHMMKWLHELWDRGIDLRYNWKVEDLPSGLAPHPPAQELEATHLRGTRYAVRPKGKLGTHGFINDKAWEVIYVNAHSPAEAVAKAKKKSTR